MRISIPESSQVLKKLHQPVRKGDILAKLEDGSVILSPTTGMIHSTIENEINIGPCLHLVRYHDLCGDCGQDLVQDDEFDGDAEYFNTMHTTTGLTFHKSEVERSHREKSERLRNEKRLVLVVDLDQTILHATYDPNLEEWFDEDNPNHSETVDMKRFQLSEDGKTYYIKLRPGTLEFLKNVHELFELHIYTMGSREYAQAIASLIDPDRIIFNDRILSRDDNVNFSEKTLKRLFPLDHSNVVIIDDRTDVWRYSPHLINVKPYFYFQGVGDINAVKPEEPQRNQVDDDDYLEVLFKILSNVHETFFVSNSLTDVSDVISVMKRNVFDGFTFCFSRCIPVGVENTLDRTWLIAQEFGAKCSDSISSSVTFLLVGGDAPFTTEKTKQASRKKIKIIHIDWMWTCVWSFERKDIEPWLINVKESFDDVILVSSSPDQPLETPVDVKILNELEEEIFNEEYDANTEEGDYDEDDGNNQEDSQQFNYEKEDENSQQDSQYNDDDKTEDTEDEKPKRHKFDSELLQSLEDDLLDDD